MRKTLLVRLKLVDGHLLTNKDDEVQVTRHFRPKVVLDDYETFHDLAEGECPRGANAYLRGCTFKASGQGMVDVLSIQYYQIKA